LRGHVIPGGLIDADDLDLLRTTDDVAVAAEELQLFNRNYHSLRWVGDQLVLRIKHAPTKEQIAMLNERYGFIATDRHIRRIQPLSPEIRDRDVVDLPRL